MNTLICIKQVPDAPNIRIDEDRMTIVREGVDSIINPPDCIALEAALALRERMGGTATVLTMGPPQSEEALREALAMGADRAVLLTDPLFAGADTLATSHVLATAVSRLKPAPDLILCGMQTIDSDTGHVGPQIAEELELPQVCGVNEILPEEDSLVVKRIADGFLETIRVGLPALLTVVEGGFPTRHLPLGALEDAFDRKEVLRWDAKDLGLRRGEIGLEGSATRVWTLRTPPPKRAGKIVSGPAQTLVDHFLQKLEALTLLDDEDDAGK